MTMTFISTVPKSRYEIRASSRCLGATYYLIYDAETGEESLWRLEDTTPVAAPQRRHWWDSILANLREVRRCSRN